MGLFDYQPGTTVSVRCCRFILSFIMAFQNRPSLEILLYLLVLSSVRFSCSWYEAILKQGCM